MSAWSFYISTLVVYFAVDLLSGVAINVQYGYAGVVNLALIVFQSFGAYIAAATTLGPGTGAGAFQQYIFGANLPYPIPLLLATLGGAALAAVVGLFSLRRMRRDYQGAVLLIVSLIALQVVTGDVPLFNGSNGLTGVPKPLGWLNLGLQSYQWAYAVWSSSSQALSTPVSATSRGLTGAARCGRCAIRRTPPSRSVSTRPC